MRRKRRAASVSLSVEFVPGNHFLVLVILRSGIDPSVGLCLLIQRRPPLNPRPPQKIPKYHCITSCLFCHLILFAEFSVLLGVIYETTA